MRQAWSVSVATSTTAARETTVWTTASSWPAKTAVAEARARSTLPTTTRKARVQVEVERDQPTYSTIYRDNTLTILFLTDADERQRSNRANISLFLTLPLI